ncbi:MAG TPA: hypothetical protein VGK23_06045 [Methanomassiliicoccales archaeon]
MRSRGSYSFIGFAAASFVIAIFCLIVIGGTSGSPPLSGNGEVIAEKNFNALPVNVVGTANIDYSVSVRSGGNVSVYLIDQYQLANLESLNSFPWDPEFSFLDVGHAEKTGNLTSGNYYLVIVNGLSVNSTGPVVVDYHLNIGGQNGQMTVIGWVWSIIALASTVAMAIGVIDLNRGKRTKKAHPKRSNMSR